MTREQTVFVAADKALQHVIDQIRDDQWDQPAVGVPTMNNTDETPSYRFLVNRHLYDDLWVPDTLAGRTIEEVGDKYDGDLLGPDPQLSFASGVEAAVSAVEALEPDDLDKIAHLSYGDFPIRDYLKHIITYRAFRSYSFAKALGLDSTMPSVLVQGLTDLILPEADAWRAMGVFGPAQEVPEGADAQTRLLALTGFLQN